MFNTHEITPQAQSLAPRRRLLGLAALAARGLPLAACGAASKPPAPPRRPQRSCGRRAGHHDTDGHRRSPDDIDHAIATGIGHTGCLVTAAAVLLSLVFLAIATSSLTIVKMFGIGLTIAIVTDAFAVRSTLTPAPHHPRRAAQLVRPTQLRSLHLRWGFWENDSVLLPDQPDKTRTREHAPIPEATTR